MNTHTPSSKPQVSLQITLLWLTLLVTTLSCGQNTSKTNDMHYNILTPEEENIIVNKGTERPFTGEYCNLHDAGTYYCKRCNTPLYSSANKFDSHCGWPSFDDELPNAVLRIPDADGRRTEIQCAHCHAHLGHVFQGEGFTPKNIRHCVNSLSLRFQPAAPAVDLQEAIFAGGCFWGMQYWFEKEAGVTSTTVGYCGGQEENPSYELVCSHTSMHAEAIRVVFNPQQVTFETLTRLFFNIHDPSQLNGQGPDLGTQYRSAIFYTSPEQKSIAQTLISQLQAKGIKVTTELTPASTFWPAEDYHQHYYTKKRSQPYCHIFVKRL